MSAGPTLSQGPVRHMAPYRAALHQVKRNAKRTLRHSRASVVLVVVALLATIVTVWLPREPDDAHGSVSDPASLVHECPFTEPLHPACVDAWAAEWVELGSDPRAWPVDNVRLLRSGPTDS